LIEPDSGAADELGRPGVQGEVDSHFWKRFGAALLFSFLSDASQYAIAKQQNTGGNNNTTIGFGQTIGGSTDVINTILKHDIDIPDVLKKNQGGVINILLARDLDLSTVYELQVKQ
jgi:type IV secretion system protein VirB10